MRKFAFHAAAIAALVSSAHLQAAQVQQAQTCLTRPEVRGLIAYYLPTVLQSTIETCTAQLSPDSYLLSRTPRLLGALEAGRKDAWPMAKQAIVKLGSERDKGSVDILASLPEAAAGPLVGAMITQELSAQIKPESCSDIDRVMTPLEPLPAANLVDMVTAVMMLGGRDSKKLSVCRES